MPVLYSFESDELLTWYTLLSKGDQRTDDIVLQVAS